MRRFSAEPPGQDTRGAAENLDERFGDPGGPDPGEATSSAASASCMRERAAQSLNPQMGRMGAEDPSTAFSAAPLGRRVPEVDQAGAPDTPPPRAPPHTPSPPPPLPHPPLPPPAHRP